MRRTHVKTLTRPGMLRKRHRLISQGLQRNYPQIFAELASQADLIIQADTADPLSRICDTGLDVIHQESPALRAAKRKAYKERKAHLKGILNEQSN